MARVLVGDLDGTLLGGTNAERRCLHRTLARHPEIAVVFATGRSVASVRDVLRDPVVPRPRWIIADVGATVVDGTTWRPVADLRARLRDGWPGADRVRAALSRFPALRYQHHVVQDGRCSFHLHPRDLTEDLTAAVTALGCSWVYSAGRYFDVLPPRASKGAAVAGLARLHGWPPTDVLVAGDSLNDLSLYGIGAHGVVVGGAEPGLTAALDGRANTFTSERPGAAGILDALQRLGWTEPAYASVVGYHRAPKAWTPSGWRAPASPNGIIPTLRAVLGRGEAEALWVAGAAVDADAPAVHAPEEKNGIPLSLLRFTPGEWSGYVNRACKESLWPVLMSEPARMRFDPAAWAQFRAANRRFAEHIADRAAPHAPVWLHDYNLWLVPGMLRETRPDLRLGLYHHTPFPPAEVFDVLPAAREIRASLAALDWAGFQTEGFAANFRATLKGTRRPRIGVHPLGVDRDAIEQAAHARTIHRPSPNTMLVLSVERLDYAKAPIHKVNAVAELLARAPELVGRFRFRLVCPPPEPGITAYDTTRAALERRIAEVNSRFAVQGRPPVEYVPHNLPFTELVDHYLAADVFWVTSLQDGMNLTAKEFVAVQAAAGRSGVLVLSRYAGAAAELGRDALLTDPRSPADLTTTLHRALSMRPSERRIRMAGLSAALGRDTPQNWAATIMSAITADADPPGVSAVWPDPVGSPTSERQSSPTT
ncbi:HAD-IIB family hydrolase [Yinghuangia sp. ASG 101]|uniref:HAD-IIB family hydrolase n=1 Tax=Yinghuangia sp. ASG 101 TaxID=2896848 RepID=UPI001E3B9A9E|nr:HAD-IIB family hydrolase [Yinghuangia sp. ASG 101]UGQ14812.1 HAD-IIB family hydrolase [Yinghuangia sp. ASG 101]